MNKKKPLTLRELQILDWLGDGGLTIKELQEMATMGYRGINKIITKLAKEGLVIRTKEEEPSGQYKQKRRTIIKIVKE